LPTPGIIGFSSACSEKKRRLVEDATLVERKLASLTARAAGNNSRKLMVDRRVVMTSDPDLIVENSIRTRKLTKEDRSFARFPFQSRVIESRRVRVLTAHLIIFSLYGYHTLEVYYLSSIGTMPLVKLFARNNLTKKVPLTSLQTKLCEIWGTKPETTKILLFRCEDWTETFQQEDVYVDIRAYGRYNGMNN